MRRGWQVHRVISVADRSIKRKDERQIAILGLAHERERVTSADVGELLGVSQPRARAIVHDMLEAGLLKRRGEGRTTYYEPAHPQQ
jgi:Mn-dependent DtxR family transcriptional regulator